LLSSVFLGEAGVVMMVRQSRFTRSGTRGSFMRRERHLLGAVLVLALLAGALVALAGDQVGRRPGDDPVLLRPLGSAPVQEQSQVDAVAADGRAGPGGGDRLAYRGPAELTPPGEKATQKKHVQLLDEGRDEFSKVYLNDDGSRSLTTTVEPSSFKDDAGVWRDVDVSLREDSSGLRLETTANSWHVSFPKDDIRQGVELSRGQQTVSFVPSGVRPAERGSRGRRRFRSWYIPMCGRVST